MDEKARFAVGIDVGTDYVRAVMGTIGKDDEVSIVGYGEVASEGMRRGSVCELNSPVKAIDSCLRQVEGMSGVPVNSATVSINGPSILSTKIDGMIAVGVADHEINDEDLARIEDAAIAGKVPANRKTLELVPYEYILDGQGGIREPFGMKGARLEIRANVISTLAPDCDNLQKVCEGASVEVHRMIPSVMAAARSVLTNKQRENGVGIVDLGGATTSVAVYEEGELQYVGVTPMGGNDITKDLATVLMTVPEVAEELKLRFVTGKFEDGKDIVITRDHEKHEFSREQVNEVAEARLEEIFDSVRKHLKAAGYDKRLPEGLVLVGGGAKMRDIDAFARKQVELAVRVGKPENITGVADDVKKPEFATAIGLLFADRDMQDFAPVEHLPKIGGKNKSNAGGFFKNLLKKFK